MRWLIGWGMLVRPACTLDGGYRGGRSSSLAGLGLACIGGSSRPHLGLVYPGSTCHFLLRAADELGKSNVIVGFPFDFEVEEGLKAIGYDLFEV